MSACREPPSKHIVAGATLAVHQHTSLSSFSLIHFRLPITDILCTLQQHMHQSEQAEPIDPCNPTPCGENSQCRTINGHAVCSCLTGYIGSAPNCRPECVVSATCDQNRACVRQKCVDPCPGTCGANARCQVVNHNAICSCAIGFSGDPFVECRRIESKHKHMHILYTC